MSLALTLTALAGCQQPLPTGESVFTVKPANRSPVLATRGDVGPQEVTEADLDPRAPGFPEALEAPEGDTGTGSIAMAFQFATPAYSVLATRQDIARLVVTLKTRGLLARTVSRAEVSQEQLVKGTASVRFTGLKASNYTVEIAAYNRAGAVIGQAKDETSVRDGQVTRLASRLRLSAGAPSSPVSGGQLELAVTIEETGVAPTPTPAPTARPRSTGHRGLPYARRGINLGNYLEAVREGDLTKGRKLQAADFRRIKAVGFEFVRVPIRWSAHAKAGAPYTVDAAFFARVDAVLKMCLDEELGVILDFHHYDELNSDAAGHTERFVAIWKQVAQRYRQAPAEVSFEILNEPGKQLASPARWNAIQRRAFSAIRESNPKRVIVAMGAGGGVSRLENLDLPADSNVVADFHFYGPLAFTHQGASWSGPALQTTGLVFPGPPARPVVPVEAARKSSWFGPFFEQYNTRQGDANPCSPGAIRAELDRAQAWSKKTGIPLLMGEFGVIDKADMGSRERWTRTVRAEAEKRGFSWAYWDYATNFGAFDHATQQWRPALKSALLP